MKYTQIVEALTCEEMYLVLDVNKDMVEPNARHELATLLQFAYENPITDESSIADVLTIEYLINKVLEHKYRTPSAPDKRLLAIQEKLKYSELFVLLGVEKGDGLKETIATLAQIVNDHNTGIFTYIELIHNIRYLVVLIYTFKED